MSNPNTIYASSFVKSEFDPDSRVLKQYSVGGTTWSLPTPIRLQDDSHLKQWKVNTTLSRIGSINSPKVNALDKLHAVGYHLNISTQTASKHSLWSRGIDSHWTNPANFTIRGFYGTNGSRINNATTAANSEVLLPIDETTHRPAAQRRPSDVRWALIECRLVYASLDPECQPPDSNYDYEFYVELPQSTKQTLNSQGNASDVTTYWGPADLRAMSQAAFKADILHQPPTQRQPYDLQAPVPPSTTARHDNGYAFARMTNDIMSVMFQGAFPYFTKQVCPVTTSRPVDQLHSVTQTLRSSSGGRDVIKPVDQFMSEFLTVCSIWANDAKFGVDAHAEAFRNMDPALQRQLEADGYTAHHLPQSLDSQHQMRLLSQLRSAAIRSERTIQRTEEQVSQFLTRQGDDVSSHLSKVLSSQAERTLSKYRNNDADGNPPKTSKPPICWHKDCGGPHRYGPDCPEYNKPGWKEKVKQGKKEFHTKVNEAKKARRRDRHSYRQMSSSQRESFAKSLTASDIRELSRLSGQSTAENTSSAADTVTYSLLPVILQNSSKPTLPVSIDPDLPSISMRFGTSPEASQSALVRVTIDSGAGLSAGHMGFWFNICEGYPNIVNQIFTCHEGKYVPIVLGGVVKQGDTTITTELPVAVELKTNYFVGDPTAPKRLNIRIALGRDVTANCIIGIPLLKPLGGCIDLNDGVLQLPRLVGDNMFPLTFARPSVSVPPMDDVLRNSKVDRSKYSDVLSAISQLRHTFLRPPQSPSGSVHQQTPAPPQQEPPTPSQEQVLRFADDQTTSDRSPFVSPATQLIDSGDSANQSDGDTVFVSDIDDDYSAASNLLGLSNADPGVDLQRSHGSSAARTRLRELALASSTSRDIDRDITEEKPPIRVVPKFKSSSAAKKRKQRPPPPKDSFGFTNPISEFFQGVNLDPNGELIRKRLHPVPSHEPHPEYDVPFDPAIHQPLLDEINLEHLTPDQRSRLLNLIKEFWCVFNPNGRVVPVRDYSCSIDTGDHPGVHVKNATYGPHESPIIDKSIAALLKVGQVKQVYGGSWLSKALLAPKPHQESITDIESFVWRFCVSYVALNAVTKVIRWPIPRCDDASALYTGTQWRWLMDAPSGFHQIPVDDASIPKLAFAGTDGDKYSYTVMPFGPVNGPAIFIMFIHDMNGSWKQLAKSRGIIIGRDCNTRIIVDDIFSWAPSFDTALRYMRCQFEICRLQRLSLSLKKSLFFNPRIEFVGHDLCADGNRPAQSKHSLLKSWPPFRTARDVSSFLGFVNFYGKYIPFLEQRVALLRTLVRTLPDMESSVATHLKDAHLKERDDIIKALLDDPCLQRYDPSFRTYLSTDFSSKGMGYCCLQPDASHEPSVASMRREMAGGPCEFLSDALSLRLRPVAFASRLTRGREVNLHSFVGELLAGKWAISHNRYRCYGIQFTWITDCRAVAFIFSYEGPNPVLQRLKFFLSLWNMTIVHRNNKWLVDADYFSRCGTELAYDPLWLQYIELNRTLRHRSTSPQGPMLPENLPGYRHTPGSSFQMFNTTMYPVDFEVDSTLPPWVSTSVPPTPINPVTLAHPLLLGETFPPSHPHLFGFNQSAAGTPELLHAVTANSQHGSRLHSCAISFGLLDPPADASSFRHFHNHHIPALAHQVISFRWAIYGFNSGHFFHTVSSNGLPFEVSLAADPLATGRALFRSIGNCSSVFNGARKLHAHLASSSATSTINGYLIHTRPFKTRSASRAFWDTQLSIIECLSLKRSLSHVVIQVDPLQDSSVIKDFTSSLQLVRPGWILSEKRVYCPDLGDSVACTQTFIIGVCKSASSSVNKHLFAEPPRITPKPISAFLHEAFDDLNYCVSVDPQHPTFKDFPLKSSPPQTAETSLRQFGSKRLFNLHRHDDSPHIVAGAGVFSTAHLCPPFESRNSNLFGYTFGIPRTIQAQAMIRPISHFEVAACYGIPKGPCLEALSNVDNFDHLRSGVPYYTSKWLLLPVLRQLQDIQTANAEVVDPSTHAAPAAVSIVPTLLDGVVSRPMPSNADWTAAYASDDECSRILAMLKEPSLLVKANLEQVHYAFRQPLRSSLIKLEDGILYLYEHINAHEPHAVKLRIVPSKFRHLLFTAFHANPIGGHLNPYRTFHRLRLRYFWPGMFAYCKKMCRACPGCHLSNLNRNSSSELIYSFPIEAPMLVLHLDVYHAGAHAGFSGAKYYLIASCGMTAFSICEALPEANAKLFAQALMKMLCQNGFCHTIVVDKDSKFRAEFSAMCELLKLHLHVASGDNHNAVLTERVNRYLNKALSIMCGERSSVRVAEESILLALYAWNSAPVDGTDVSRSLIVKGREFRFPVDFLDNKHFDLISHPSSVASYAKNQQMLIQASRDIAKVVIEERRAHHRELVNSLRPDPRTYEVGDRVFARRAVKSDKKRGRVDKLTHPYTGPWEVVSRLHGASYEIRHLSTGRLDKKHASALSPFPPSLIPLSPLDGTDTSFSQLHKPIDDHPYKEAGIKGFHRSSNPFSILHGDVIDDADLHMPTIAEMNAELFPWADDAEESRVDEQESRHCHVDTFLSPPAQHPAPSPRKFPDPASLSVNIIGSQDKLFFISCPVIGNPSIFEWSLVRVNLKATHFHNPNCASNGKYLVDFVHAICRSKFSHFPSVALGK